MQLNRISAVVRPRNHWEAIDLGFIMARAWAPHLYITYLLLSVPFFLLVLALFFNDTLWVILIVWWTKPLFDRIHLYVMSRELFGEKPHRKDIIRNFFAIRFTHLLYIMTLGRFNISRSFDMPVTQLEQLHGNTHRNRVNLLHYQGAHAAFLLHLMGFIIEILLTLFFIALFFMFIPTELNLETATYWQEFWQILGSILGLIFYYLSIVIVSPFYVAGGFALYLNRRTHLEGWDIELVFRQLAQRLNTQRD